MNKTIVFDADGTLIDSLWVWDDLTLTYLREKNILAEKRLNEILWTMSFDEGVAYIKMKYDLSESKEQIKDSLQSLLYERYKNDVELFDGVSALLSSLKKSGCSLLIASATPRKLLEPCFERLDIYKYFDSIITEEMYGVSKANELFFEKLIKEFDLNLSETIVVDDANHALKSAKSLNLKCIGILNDKDESKFRDCADLLVNSIGELDEKSINNCWK